MVLSQLPGCSFLGVVYVSRIDSFCRDEELPPPDQYLCSSFVEVIQCHRPGFWEFKVFSPFVDLSADLMYSKWVFAKPFFVLFHWRPWFEEWTYRQVRVWHPLEAIGTVASSFEAPGYVRVVFFPFYGLRGLSLMADADLSRFWSVAFSVWSSWPLASLSASRR